MAHSLGCVPLKLHDWKVDAAVVCTYKYINAGPGNLGAIFIHEDMRPKLQPGLRGWFGTDRKVLLAQEPVFTPSPEQLKAYQISTFDPLQLCRLSAALEYFIEAGPVNIYTKTKDLIEYFKILLDSLSYIQVVNKSSEYSGHVAFRVVDSGLTTKEFYGQLSQKIVCDYKDRYDVIRMSCSALYLHFNDVYRAFEIIKSMEPEREGSLE